MDIPCSMCLENPAAPSHRCHLNDNKFCDCCNECTDACDTESYYNIVDSEEDAKVDRQ